MVLRTATYQNKGITKTSGDFCATGYFRILGSDQIPFKIEHNNIVQKVIKTILRFDLKQFISKLTRLHLLNKSLQNDMT